MPPAQTLLRWRLLILAWLIAWITTIPLFHIHIPDTTDRLSLLQSGGAHTVFTPDLPGEFSPPFHDKQHSAHLSQRGVNSPELGLALLDEKSEVRKARGRAVVAVTYHFSATTWLPCVGLELLAEYWKAHLPDALTIARAPPPTINLFSYTRTIFPLLSSSPKVQVNPSSSDPRRAGKHKKKPSQAEYGAFVGVGVNTFR